VRITVLNLSKFVQSKNH